MLEALKKVPFKEWEKLKSTPKNKYTPRQALISLVNALEEEHMGLSNYVEDEYNILSQALDIRTALVTIEDLCIDYDGFETVDGLKSLIDDIKAIAKEALTKEELGQ